MVVVIGLPGKDDYAVGGTPSEAGKSVAALPKCGLAF